MARESDGAPRSLDFRVRDPGSNPVGRKTWESLKSCFLEIWNAEYTCISPVSRPWAVWNRVRGMQAGWRVSPGLPHSKKANFDHPATGRVMPRGPMVLNAYSACAEARSQ